MQTFHSDFFIMKDTTSCCLGLKVTEIEFIHWLVSPQMIFVSFSPIEPIHKTKKHKHVQAMKLTCLS